MLAEKEIQLLIIEDNLGDVILLEEYLYEALGKLVIGKAESFAAAQKILSEPHRFDAIFLDLSLPDHSGKELVTDVVQLAGLVPVIVLTGYSNKEFGIKTLELGVSDYLAKDDLDSAQLSKSLMYSIERKRIEKKFLESNERFEIVAKATSDTIWDWDIKNKTVLCNQGIIRVFGYTEADYKQTEYWWRSKIHPDDFRKVISALSNSFVKGESLMQLEYRFMCADGSYKYVLDRAYLVLGFDKKPIRMIGAMQDITRKKSEEQQLRLFESVITNTSDAVVIFEAHPHSNQLPTLFYINKAFSLMTGYSLTDVIGVTELFFHGPLTASEEVAAMQAAMLNGKSCTIEIIHYNKNGDPFWVNISVSPVLDRKGVLTHWISIQKDVTDRRKYLQAIEEQNEKLKDIAWTQSHLVRAPLARIMGLSSMLSDLIIDEEADVPFSKQELVTLINNSSEELDKIIRDIVQKTENI